MTSKKELSKQLDRLPSDTPHNIDPDLARLHREYHIAGEIDEEVPGMYISINGINDLPRVIADLKELKPTHLQTAQEILDDLYHQASQNLASEWSGMVLRILLAIHTQHYPPKLIKHKY